MIMNKVTPPPPPRLLSSFYLFILLIFIPLVFSACGGGGNGGGLPPIQAGAKAQSSGGDDYTFYFSNYNSSQTVSSNKLVGKIKIETGPDNIIVQKLDGSYDLLEGYFSVSTGFESGGNSYIIEVDGILGAGGDIDIFSTYTKMILRTKTSGAWTREEVSSLSPTSAQENSDLEEEPVTGETPITNRMPEQYLGRWDEGSYRINPSTIDPYYFLVSPFSIYEIFEYGSGDKRIFSYEIIEVSAGTLPIDLTLMRAKDTRGNGVPAGLYPYDFGKFKVFSGMGGGGSGNPDIKQAYIDYFTYLYPSAAAEIESKVNAFVNHYGNSAISVVPYVGPVNQEGGGEPWSWDDWGWWGGWYNGDDPTSALPGSLSLKVYPFFVALVR